MRSSLWTSIWLGAQCFINTISIFHLVSDEDRFFYILSTIPKAKIEPKADIRYHVFGEVLDYRDFQSLEGDGWLTITVRIYIVLQASFII